MTKKFCVDCEHHEVWTEARWTTGMHKCMYRMRLRPPEQWERDLVTGALSYKNADNCYAMRDAPCGPEAHFFEPKPPQEGGI